MSIPYRFAGADGETVTIVGTTITISRDGASLSATVNPGTARTIGLHLTEAGAS